MFKNYLLIAWRNFKRNKTFSIINVFGLSIGIACFLLIVLFISYELSFDRFNKKSDRIVRVTFKASINGESIKEPHVMPPTAQVLKANFPEVEHVTRMRMAGIPIIRFGDRTFTGDSFAYIDPNFFDVFTFNFIKGDYKTALNEPNTIVITSKMARKYFKDHDPVGRIIDVKSWNNSYKITGVVEDLPDNSHFHSDFFISMESLSDSKSLSWMTSEYFTYLLLQKDYDYKLLQAKLPQIVDKYMGPQFKQAFGMSLSQFKKNGSYLGLVLQPLTDIHLFPPSNFEIEPSGDIRYIYLFGAVALFILLIACINFMNLSTAGASKRAKEVGIRKVLGSVKRSLIRQFLVESALLTTLALVVAVSIFFIALPYFNDLTGKKLEVRLADVVWTLPLTLLFGFIISLIAGSYPAFFLSSFKPIAVLKGKFNVNGNSVGLRRGLVVFQFFISATLIIGTVVVYSQLKYIQNKKLGYDKDHVLIVEQTWRLADKEESFRQNILKDPRVVAASVSGFIPACYSNNNNFTLYSQNDPSAFVKTLKYEVDDQYIPTLGLTIKEGRNFSKEFGLDTASIIINEVAAKMFGIEKNPIGSAIMRTTNEGIKNSYNVVGVVKDFHFKSLHERISPLVMIKARNPGVIIIKTKTKDYQGILATIKSQWDEYNVEVPFSYSFMDDRLKQTYLSEEKAGQILGIFAGITIFIACLGLFGLARFSTEQRLKEIGIRKVLGASTLIILNIVTKDFLKLVLIACVIASPIAWYVMNLWLQDFAYKINIRWWMLIIPCITSIAISILTVSHQAIKAALSNPVKSLRAD